MAQVITGTSADDSFSGTIEQTDYLYEFTDNSHYNEVITDVDTENLLIFLMIMRNFLQELFILKKEMIVLIWQIKI